MSALEQAAVVLLAERCEAARARGDHRFAAILSGLALDIAEGRTVHDARAAQGAR